MTLADGHLALLLDPLLVFPLGDLHNLHCPVRVVKVHMDDLPGVLGVGRFRIPDLRPAVLHLLDGVPPWIVGGVLRTRTVVLGVEVFGHDAGLGPSRRLIRPMTHIGILVPGDIARLLKGAGLAGLVQAFPGTNPDEHRPIGQVLLRLLLLLTGLVITVLVRTARLVPTEALLFLVLLLFRLFLTRAPLLATQGNWREK